MKLDIIINKWKEFVRKLNEKGIPVPTIRDPKTQMGSVSFTMVCISFGVAVLTSLFALAMIINKWAGFFTAPESSINALKEAFSMAFELCLLSCSLYWGRKFQKDEKGQVSLDNKEENK